MLKHKKITLIKLDNVIIGALKIRININVSMRYLVHDYACLDEVFGT